MGLELHALEKLLGKFSAREVLLRILPPLMIFAPSQYLFLTKYFYMFGICFLRHT